MNQLNIPAGHQQVMPYLILINAGEFFTFMKSVFNAEERSKVMKTETEIMHAELVVGNCTIMFADGGDQFPAENAGLFIYVQDVDVTYRKALEAGASSRMEPADQPYGRSCGVKDPFGNTWWITSPPGKL
jgi:PhnB protein